MKVYFNIKTSQGVETVDELSSKDFKSFKDFRLEKNRLVREYHMCNMNVYTSQRCTREWGK